MFINTVLKRFQGFLSSLSEKSVVLKNLDKFIFIMICMVILFSIFAPSDIIGYFAIVGIFLTLIKVLTTKDFEFRYTKFEFCLIVYLAFVLISVAGSSLFALSLKGALKTLVYLGYYVTCVVYLNDHKKDIWKIFGLFAFCLGMESVVGLLQNSSHVSALAGWQDTSNLNPEQVMTRVYGTLKPLNPNLFGGYILSLLPVAYGITAIFVWKKNYTFAAAGVAYSLLATLVMIMSGCRGVFIAFPLMMLVPAIVLLKRVQPDWREILYKIYAAICGLGILMICASTSLRARVLSIFALRGDSSTSFRFNVYQSAIQMFKDNPFLGIGVGNQNFREIYGLYMRTGYDALSAYNIYLETAVESGIYALLAFLAFIIMMVKAAFRSICRTANVEKIIILTIALTSVVGILCHGFVDTIFYRPQFQFVFWTMVAVIRVFSKSESYV